jgi:hypothetical protein
MNLKTKIKRTLEVAQMGIKRKIKNELPYWRLLVCEGSHVA